MASARRLGRIQHALAPSPQVIGTLTLGNISYPVPTSTTPSRLPHITPLDPNDPRTREHLHFLLQKFVLGQDVFLITQPGPYARRLALTFCRYECTSIGPRLAVVLTARQHGKCRVRVYHAPS